MSCRLELNRGQMSEVGPRIAYCGIRRQSLTAYCTRIALNYYRLRRLCDPVGQYELQYRLVHTGSQPAPCAKVMLAVQHIISNMNTMEMTAQQRLPSEILFRPKAIENRTWVSLLINSS